jgi:hypothetical protein
MTLADVPDAALLDEIRRFQKQQKRYPATSEIHRQIGETLLAPLFAEMARRQQSRGV